MNQETESKHSNQSDMSLEYEKKISSKEVVPADSLPASVGANRSTCHTTNVQQKIYVGKLEMCLDYSFHCQRILFWLVAFCLAISGIIATVYIFHNDWEGKHHPSDNNFQHFAVLYGSHGHMRQWRRG